MKVKELIEKLSEFEKDLTVMWDTGEIDGYLDINKIVKKCDVWIETNDNLGNLYHKPKDIVSMS